MTRRPPPRHPPHPSRTFQLEAAAVQQGLFSPHAYERKPAREEEIEVDERQIDLFGPPPPKKNPRRNPRQTYPDGRLIPILGDEVYQRLKGFMGSGGSVRGVVVKGRGGALRVKLTGYSGMMPTTDVVEGKTMPLTSGWTVVNDPIHERREAEVKKAVASKAEIEWRAKEAVEAYVQRHGLVPASLDSIAPGMVLFMPWSEGRFGSGDPQRIHVEEAVVEEVTSRDFVYDGGRTSSPKGWYLQGSERMRENTSAPAPKRKNPKDATHFYALIAAREALENSLKQVSAELKSYPRGSTGLTPDESKDARWYELRRESDRIFTRLREVNSSLTSRYKKELSDLRDERRRAKLLPRENKGHQTFIRRTPAREGAKRRYRYTYDPDLATRVNVRARVKEKLRIPHHGIPGHYEVVERLAPDVVGVIHDETGHAMAISDVALRELARDVYRPALDTTPAEDVRHRHEREDALPRSRDEAYRAIQQASDIDDHDFAQADQAYRAWKAGKGKRGRKRPPPLRGGQLDAFEADLRRDARGRVKHFSSLLEAFEHASRGAQTWRDLEPVLALLRDVPGFENARFPEEVYNRHIQHEAELADQGHTLDVEHYGVTMVPGMEVGEAVFLAATTTPPRLRKPLSESDAAIGAHDEGGDDVSNEEEDDLWGWGWG